MRIGRFLVRQWIYCLRANVYYRRYCRAKKLELKSDADKLELNFSRITELYDDWGPLDQIDLKPDSDSYKEWEKTRIPLFFLQSHKVTLVKDAKNYEYASGRLLISVPLHPNKQETIDEVTKYIDFFYNAKATRPILNAIVKKMAEPLPMPKYQLYGDVTKATRRRISRAIRAYSAQRVFVDSKLTKLSQTDTIIKIMQQPKNPFRWSMSESEKAAHSRGEFKRTLFNSSKVKLLTRAREDFDALVKNVIHGRFPDFG